jgi:NAD(P) transhydrogenase subunit alpha
MRIAVPKESAPQEQRVALVPESCKKLIQAGYELAVEAGAGTTAGFGDAAYQDVGAAVAADPAALLGSADLVLKVNAPALASSGRDETAWMRPGCIYLGSLMPLRNLDAVRALAARRITAFSTDAIPRSTRAQSMDTLSSMANISGYKGVLLAATVLPKYFPMLMTAAGMVPPAKVFVIGAAVAGLQAIATARRLGANVAATDVRPEVKEQIESVGAKYVGIELAESAVAGGGYAKELSEEDRRRQGELLAEQCAVSDVVITTALIGGVFAPKLITADMVHAMKPGAVIVDLAADGGGNCELSRLGETAVVGGVTILAPLNLPATMPLHASLLFSRNLTAFIQAFTKDKAFQLDLNDDIQRGALITYEGEVRHARTRDALSRVGA